MNISDFFDPEKMKAVDEQFVEKPRKGWSHPKEREAVEEDMRRRARALRMDHEEDSPNKEEPEVEMAFEQPK